MTSLSGYRAFFLLPLFLLAGSAAHAGGALPRIDTTATTVVSLPFSTPGQPGDIVSMPIVLIASYGLDSCGALDFTIVVSFDRTMLLPVNGARGLSPALRGQVTYKGRRVPKSDTLGILQFVVALGDSDRTTMHIESFMWTDGICPVAITTSDGVFRPLKICRTGGTGRYVVATGLNVALITSGVYDGASAGQIGFVTPELGRTRVSVSDVMGRTVATLLDAPVESGAHTVPFAPSSLPSGLYLCTLQTPTARVTRTILVSR